MRVKKYLILIGYNFFKKDAAVPQHLLHFKLIVNIFTF